MEYTISEKMAGLKPSAIREMFKYAADPAVISLAAGSPSSEALPVEEIKRLTRELLEDNPYLALQYGLSEGYIPLRDYMKKFLAERYQSFDPSIDDLFIVSGAQQTIDLTCKVLCNEGDAVICENPSFIGALNAFRSYNTRLVGVDVESDGISIEKLEDALKANPNTRFIYLIPNFQNPTGITMSLEKRKACYALAQKYNTIILEDNPYGDLRFAGEPLPTIKSMDTDGRVIYAGTFSKILSPGIRVGIACAPQGLMGRLVVAKQCTDVHSSMLSQMLAYYFITQCDMESHLANLRTVYARKCSLMLSELDRSLGNMLELTRPQGGLFIWATMPGMENTDELATCLVRDHKVCVVPGSTFCAQMNTPTSSFRLNFSTPTDEQIVEGIGRLTQALKK
ncbi:PLP-dependent aminotransferase family protein [Oscillospiraceae bacterium MB08-C2-2]|nr:PLP-dependent aminotransferase family protein [Oscillospiraceae bacterium MB08-C2-2]